MKHLTILILTFLIGFVCLGQSKSKGNKGLGFFEFHLANKQVLKGELISKNTEGLVIKTAGKDSVFVYNFDVLYAKEIAQEAKEEILNSYFVAPNNIMPSAYNLPKGDFCFKSTMLIVNRLSYGITDNLTAALGIEALSANGAMTLSLRYSGSINDNTKMYFGYLTGINLNQFDVLHANYNALLGGLTFGNHESNFSIGAGFDPTRDVAKNYLISLSAYKMISPKFAIITENFLMMCDELNSHDEISKKDKLFMITVGCKIIGKKARYIDINYLLPLGVDDSFYGPDSGKVGFVFSYNKIF